MCPVSLEFLRYLDSYNLHQLPDLQRKYVRLDFLCSLAGFKIKYPFCPPQLSFSLCPCALPHPNPQFNTQTTYTTTFPIVSFLARLYEHTGRAFALPQHTRWHGHNVKVLRLSFLK